MFELVQLNAEMRVLSAGSIFHPLYFGVCVCLCAYVHVCVTVTLNVRIFITVYSIYILKSFNIYEGGNNR